VPMIFSKQYRKQYKIILQMQKVYI